jgi:hypothetical protein
LTCFKRMVGCRDMVISSFGVGWCTKTKFAGFACCGLCAYD